MPYHAKDSLEALIRRHGPLNWRETLSIGVKLAGALDAAHRVGTLHRDVKPANILLTDYGEPQLTDFGIARIAGGFETATGVITGSPAFTAPEVLEGATPTVASDIYSLGATLFCALTGHAAYERRSGEQVVAQFLRIASEPVPDLRDQGLPDDVATAIEMAMARDPADRPTTVAEVGERLREIQRRTGSEVDQMAQPVELGVERRARQRRFGATSPHATDSREVPSQVATRCSGPRQVDRCSSRRWPTTAGAHSRRRAMANVAAQWRDELTRCRCRLADRRRRRQQRGVVPYPLG
jgi:serine/threonine-protein kinase PknK